MALIERGRELDQLETALKNGTAGRGSTVLIEGPPGIGKSALLDHARGIADGLGMEVLSASAAEFETGLGFAVTRSLLDRSLAELGAEERAVVLQGAAHLALGPLGRRGATEGALEPDAAIHGLYWLCANLADRKPLLLAVDDLHWADEASLLFLGYLSRRAAEHPLVICATTRPIERESSERYLAAVSDASGDVVRPTALSADGVTRLVNDAFATPAAPEFADACAQITGGNPYLLVQVLATLAQEGIEPTVEEAARLGGFSSATLSRSLFSRVARLGPDAKGVAGAVAVLGLDADLRRVAALCDVDADIVVEAVDGLRREGILTTSGAISFVHPLIRHALYTDLAEPARGRAHLRAARLLAADGDQPRVASHLLVAERNADEWVVERLRNEAAAALDGGAPATAAMLLKRALAEPPHPRDRAAIGLERGRALIRSGDIPGAEEALRQALELADEPLLRTDIAIELGRALRLAGNLEEAIAVLDEAVKNVPAGHHDIQMSIELEIAVAWHMGGPASPWVERLTAVAERADGTSLSDRSVRSMCSYVFASSGMADAHEVGRLARSGATPIGVTDPPQLLQLTAAGLAMSGSFGEALEALDRALEICRRAGDPAQFGFVSITRTWIAYRAGLLLECLADAQSVIDAPFTSPLYGNYAAALAINSLIERGALEDAERLLADRGLESDTDELGTVTGAIVLLARGRLHQARGRFAQAVADLNRCHDVLQQVDCASPAFCETRAHVALAHLALEDRDAARDVAAEDLRLARAYGAPRELGIALRTLGLVEGGPRGIELLDESVHVLADSEAALEYAKSLVELGAAFRRSGKSAQAVEHLRQGLDLASRCGALAVADRAREELIAAGARPRRERLSGPDSLTASELRVARMAADGRSNPEIAQALFVTRRTVEVHLTHAYRKLGISSRGALAAALVEPLSE